MPLKTPDPVLYDDLKIDQLLFASFYNVNVWVSGKTTYVILSLQFPIVICLKYSIVKFYIIVKIEKQNLLYSTSYMLCIELAGFIMT